MYVPEGYFVDSFKYLQQEDFTVLAEVEFCLKGWLGGVERKVSQR